MHNGIPDWIALAAGLSLVAADLWFLVWRPNLRAGRDLEQQEVTTP